MNSTNARLAFSKLRNREITGEAEVISKLVYPILPKITHNISRYIQAILQTLVATK